MKIGTLLGWALPLVTLLGSNGAALAAPTPADKTLWVSDDVNKTIYNISLDGTVLTSFNSGSISELAFGIGADVDTLWTAKEGSNLIVHMNKLGATLSSFPGTQYDPAASTPEGVAVDFADGTLWIVDDVTELVYHTQTDGTLIASFPTSSFDPLAISCQGIAADPVDGTLWLTDNHTWRVYNVTKQGALVSSFPVSAFDAAATNLQGIGVDEVDRSLWLTDRDTHKIYNVARTGQLQSSIDATKFGSLNPTGVAVERTELVSFSILLADIADGMSSGLITTAAGKKLTNTVKQAQKQYDKGHLGAAASIMGGFQDQVNGFVANGLVDEVFARALLASSAVLIDSLVGP